MPDDLVHDREHGISKVLHHTLAGIHEVSQSFVAGLAPEEKGEVISVLTGIARVKGLPGTGFEELLRFPGNLYGITFSLEKNEIGVILLGESAHLQTGDVVERTGRVMDVPVGEELIGRVIDPVGNPLDDKPRLSGKKKLRIERRAPSIMDRAPVTKPLQTGIKVIDALIPIGRGQRELILGDRQTGKTSIAINTILNQKDQNVVCVYCSIGQRASSIAKTISVLQSYGAMEYTVVVITKGNDSPGLIYLAPYSATSIAEYFMEKGRDVLIVYDDLTHHARAYRELSLLLRRPPGREAFPGDIFYIHSRLLERSTHLNQKLGNGSLTALPIIETEAQTISAYIPTNLISITDGQIYLSPKLFELGILPAVEVGKSVSRVGGKAQPGAYRSVSSNLKLAFVQFEELEIFARFGTRLDPHTEKILSHGQRIRECLKQPEYETIPMLQQIVVLLSLSQGLFNNIPLSDMRQAEQIVRNTVKSLPAEITDALNAGKGLNHNARETILKLANDQLRISELTG